MADDRIDSIINSGKIIPELQSVYDAMNKVLELILQINQAAKNMGFGKSFKEGFDAMKQATSGLNELNKAKAEAIAKESKLKQALLASKNANQELTNQIKQLQLAEARARAERNANKASIISEDGSLNKLRETLNRLRREWDAMGPASRKANQQTLRDIQALDQQVRKLEADTGRYQRNVGNYPKLVGGVTGLLGAFGIATGGAAISKEIFDTTVSLDSLNAALKVVSGSEQEYAKNQQFLLATSERLGLNIIEITKAYKLFYAASTQSGISANETRKIFNSVAEVSANLKLSQEDTNGVLLAFSQIASKGKVQAEELRGQIGERLPGAFSIAAKAIGVTQQQLNKMLQNGEVIASEFLPKFAAELEKTFGVDNRQNIDSLQGSINRLKNEFTRLVSDNQSGLSKFFSMIINFGRESLITFNSLSTEVANLYTQLTNPVQRRLGQFFDIVAQRKSANDPVVAQFQAANPAEQRKLFEDYKALAVASQKQYNDAVSQFGKRSTEARAALLQLIQDADLLTRVNQVLKDQNTAAAPESKKVPTEKELNAAARLQEREIKATADARKADLQTQIDDQKAILDNDKAGFAERMAAAENYYALKGQMAEVDADAEKKRIQVEIGRNKASAAEIKAIDANLKRQQAENTRELGKNIVGILADNADKETKQLASNFQKQKQQLEKQQNNELAGIQDLYKKRIITKQQYEAEELRITNKYDILQLQAEAELQQAVIEILKQRGEPVADAEAKLQEIVNKIRALDLKYFDDTEKQKTDTLQKELDKRHELELQYADRIKDLRSEIVSFLTELGSAQFEREKNRVQDQIDLVEQQSEAEIAAVRASSDSADEKAAKEQAINLQAQAQKQALERKQRDIDARAAQFQKAMSLVQIGITTAESVFKIQAQAAILASNPVTAALAGLAYAQIPVVIAAGALQAAAIAAKPIPRYRFGIDNHPGGAAIVGDGGVNEVVEAPDGRTWITPDHDTLTYLPERYKVHPSVDKYLAAASAGLDKRLPPISSDMHSVDVLTQTVTSELKKHGDRLIQGMERNKTTMIVKNTWSGLKATAVSAQSRIDFLNREIYW